MNEKQQRDAEIDAQYENAPEELKTRLPLVSMAEARPAVLPEIEALIAEAQAGEK